MRTWLLVLGAMTLFVPAARAGSGPDSLLATETRDLAATAEVPWNPAVPLPSRRGWERAVLLPGRVVSMPLSWLGAGLRSSLFYAEEHELISLQPVSIESGSKRRKLLAFQLPGGIGERAGLGAAIVVRTPGPSDRRSLATLRYAATLRSFNSTQVMLVREPFDLQYGYDWRPEVVFFGLGSSTPEAFKSGYAWQDEYVRATATLKFPRDTVGQVPHAVLRAWLGPRSRVLRHTREGGVLPFESRFPGLATATLDRRVDHLIYGAGGWIDWREGRPHWSRGGKLRLDAERVAAPVKALALHSAESRGAEFTRIAADGEAGFSMFRDPRTLRLRVRFQDETIGTAPERMLIPDLSRLGGHEGLAAFEPGRFHDRDLLLTRVMYLFPLVRLLEFDVHSEWGSVYRDLWSDASIRSLHNSYGFALRGRSSSGANGSFGVDLCNEGFRVNFKVGSLE